MKIILVAVSFLLVFGCFAGHVECSSTLEKLIKVGPYGEFPTEKLLLVDAWYDIGKVCGIYISHSSKGGVKSIQFAYASGGLSEKHGGNGNTFESITIDYPTEFMIGISGHYAAYGLSSITLVTNNRIYGPFGAAEGFFSKKFSMTFLADEFFGFHGYSSSDTLCAIGAYVKPSFPLSEQTSLTKSKVI